MIKRQSEQYLKHWFDKTRRKPLVLRGARQVGKSTLVRQFAEHHGLVLHEINLEKHLLLDDVFKSLDIKRIVMELEGLLGRNILEDGSLLFLDEVQATPHALAALRYFRAASDPHHAKVRIRFHTVAYQIKIALLKYLQRHAPVRKQDAGEGEDRYFSHYKIHSA